LTFSVGRLLGAFFFLPLPGLLNSLLDCPRQLVLTLQLDLRILAGDRQPGVAADPAGLDGAASDFLP
jgi:hypothetical protein